MEAEGKEIVGHVGWGLLVVEALEVLLLYLADVVSVSELLPEHLLKEFDFIWGLSSRTRCLLLVRPVMLAVFLPFLPFFPFLPFLPFFGPASILECESLCPVIESESQKPTCLFLSPGLLFCAVFIPSVLFYCFLT